MLLRGPSSKKVLVSRALVRTDEFLLFALIGWLTYVKSGRGVVCTWRSKDDFWEPVLSSHNVDCSKSHLLLIEFGSNCLCPLSHIACLGLSF